MSNQSSTIWTDPGKILSIAQLLLLIITLTYVFAYLQKDVEQNSEMIRDNETELRRGVDYNSRTYVRKDVFNEQYRQIIERLDKLNEKLSEEN